MALQVIDPGSGPAVGGEPIHEAFKKARDNFAELYGKTAALDADKAAQDALILGANNEADRANLRVDNLNGTQVKLNTSSFTNNLGPGIDTVQKLADAVDDLVSSGGVGSGASTSSAVAHVVPGTSRILQSTDTNVENALGRLDAEVAKRLDVVAIDSRVGTLETTTATVPARLTAAEAAIAAEASRAAIAESTVDTRVTAEVTRATAAEAATLVSAKSYADAKIAAVVGVAPAALDTLAEIATQLLSDETAAGALTLTVANETTARIDGDAALATRATALEASQTAQDTLLTTHTAQIAASTVSVAAETARATAVEAGLNTRVVAAEALAVTHTTQIAAGVASVTAEQTRATGVEAGLNTRVAALETDPTTKTYVDGQNTVDRARLTALEAGTATTGYVDAQNVLDRARLTTLETDVVKKTYVDAQDALDRARLTALETDVVKKTYVDTADSALANADVASGAVSGNTLTLTKVGGGTITVDVTTLAADVKVVSGSYNAATKSIDFVCAPVSANFSVPVSALLPVSVAKSITGNGSTTALELDGDVATPGNTKYYGTDGTGVKGFFPVPAGTPTLPPWAASTAVLADELRSISLFGVTVALKNNSGARTTAASWAITEAAKWDVVGQSGDAGFGTVTAAPAGLAFFVPNAGRWVTSNTATLAATLDTNAATNLRRIGDDLNPFALALTSTNSTTLPSQVTNITPSASGFTLTLVGPTGTTSATTRRDFWFRNLSSSFSMTINYGAGVKLVAAGTELRLHWNGAAFVLPSAAATAIVQTKATTYTTTPDDFDTYIRLTAAAAVPTLHASVAADIGKQIIFRNATAASIQLLPGSATVTGSAIIPANQSFAAVCVAAGVYDLIGGL